MAKPSRTSSFSKDKLRDKEQKEVISVEIPEWAELRTIHVFAGIEHLAYFPPKKKGEKHRRKFIKISRCNRCGKCCIEPVKGWKDPKTGRCKYLKVFSDGTTECSLGAMRPFACCIGNAKGESYCSVKFKEIKE